MIKAGFLVDRLSRVVGGVGVIGAAALFACIAGTNPATAASGKTVASADGGARSEQPGVW